MGEVSHVAGDQGKAIDRGHGCDLAVDEGRRFACGGQAGPLGCVPFGGPLVIGEDGHGRQDDLVEIALDGIPFGGRRQAMTAEAQFMPDDRSDGDLIAVPAQLVEDGLRRRGAQRFRDDVGVKEELQKVTSRPGVLSRASSKRVGSMSSFSRST